jgi:DNA modification methylase
MNKVFKSELAGIRRCRRSYEFSGEPLKIPANSMKFPVRFVRKMKFHEGGTTKRESREKKFLWFMHYQHVRELLL